MAKIASIISVFLLMLISSSCSKTRGVNPPQTEQVLYVCLSTYIEGNSFGQLYMYDVAEMVPVDSFPIDAFVCYTTTTPSELIVQTDTIVNSSIQSEVELLHVQSGARRLIVDDIRKISAIKAGDLLVCNSQPNHDAVVINIDSGDTIRTVPNAWRFGENLRGSELIFPKTGDPETTADDTLLQLVDVFSGEVLGEFAPRSPSGSAVAVVSCRLHADKKTVLLIGRADPNYRLFMIADMVTGDVLLSSDLFNTAGNIAVSPEGKFVAVSDPGAFFTGGPRYIDVFDFESRQRLRRLDEFAGIVSNSVGQLLFLSDSLLVSAPNNSFSATGPLTLIDLQTFKVVDTIQLPYTNESLHVWPGVNSLSLGLRTVR